MHPRLALCLDISGSMSRRYRDGSMQALLDRLLATAPAGGDGPVDVFAFGDRAHHAPALTRATSAGYVTRLLTEFPLEPGTNYSPVMALVREHYFGSAAVRRAPLIGGHPVLVVFVTDGQTQSPSSAAEQLRAASYEPIFWQFLGLGRACSPARRPVRNGPACGGSGSGVFGFLTGLDAIEGRYLDNADFVAMEEPAVDPQLGTVLTRGYLDWRARAGGLALR